MRRYNQRDEEGRFTSRNERGRGSSRSDWDDDDRGYGRYGRDNDGYEDRYVRSQWRNRDEEGRFMSRDDDDYRGTARNSPYASYGRNGSGRWVDTDDDGRYRRSGDSRFERQHPRDEYGRFTSGSSNARNKSSGSSSRASSGKSSGPGRGWHGDPEGHAEAGSHSHDND